MIKTIRIKLNPTPEQQEKLEESANISRWAYNWALGKQCEYFESTGKLNKISDGELRKEITQLKKTEEYKWLFHVSCDIVKQKVKDCCEAINRFHYFSKLHGYKYREKAIKSGKKLTFRDFKYFPRFKKKFISDLAFYNDNVKLKTNGNAVLLANIGWVELSEKNKIPKSKYTNPRIKYDGKYWYITVGVEKDVELQELTDVSIGIDLGIKDLAIVSNIEKPFKNINKTETVKKLNKRLKQKERRFSKIKEKLKEKKGYTQNLIKLKNKIKLINRRISNIRINHIHQITTQIAKTKPRRVVMEDLNVQGMIKNRHLSKAIAQQCFNKFINIMKYKCEFFGIEFIQANRFYPSSKTCSNCGNIKKDLKLKDRVYKCECGFKMDRDKNASINLANYQLA